jgi:diacylglycerol kinase (ATP)
MFKTLANIPRRAKNSMYYSLCGLGVSFKNEESVKLEALSLVALIIVVCLVSWPAWKKLALIGAFLLIPLTEMLNSALEDLSNLVSPGYNEKIKNAKDKGSAAVLIAIIINCVVLAALIKAE